MNSANPSEKRRSRTVDWRKNNESSLIELEQLNNFLPDLVENLDEEDDENDDSSFLKSFVDRTCVRRNHQRVESFGITEFEIHNPKVHTSTLQT